jgi:hypothetical protein
LTWRRGNAPDWHFDFVFLFEIFVPQHVAFGGIEAMQHAGAAQGICSAFVNLHRRARPRRIADAVVWAFVGVTPQGLAVGGIKAMHAFDLRWFHEAIGHVHSSLRHGWSAVTRPNFGAPLDGQLRRRKLFDDSRFTPDPIALRPAPLRPVIGMSQF